MSPLQAPPAGVAPQAVSPAGQAAPGDWRTQRVGPLSGRYEGDMTAPTAGRHQLELRVDVDPRYDNSPVTDRLSGDLFQVNQISLPGRAPDTWRVYRESWVVEQPVVDTSQPNRVVITGTVRYYKGLHPTTTIRVEILWGPLRAAGPAQVQFLQTGTVLASFNCVKKSDAFRQLHLEIDVCQSVNQPPLRPSYDTLALTSHPAGLAGRTLTIEEAYQEAGVAVTISPSPTVVNDLSPKIEQWSAADLHHALEEHFTQARKSWPRWDMWGFLASRFTDRLVGGIMFDTVTEFGGAGKPPERQGFAVFRNHEWFDDLVAGPPSTAAQAEAARQFLYTWVHESGHAFNFLHSWDKNRPDALSWMNYDWKYDQRNGQGSFWSHFAFRFDDEELIHLRHGDRASVIMGGDPWASGGHIEAPPGAEYLKAPPGAMAQIDGEAPIELRVQSKGYFEFMEPVSVELRLRNLLADLPLLIDARLNPDFGNVTIYLRRPDGRILEYSPIACKLATLAPDAEWPRQLAPAGASGPGQKTDRYSEEVFLSYGRYGFYFDQPGTYSVRALYQGKGDVLIPSNVHRLHIGHPPSREADRQAQDFFSYEVGMSLYLQGSRSPYLATGMRQLEEVAQREPDSMLGVKAAMTVAGSLAKPFYQLEKLPPKAPPALESLSPTFLARAPEPPAPAQALVREHPARPEEALRLTKAALAQVKQANRSELNQLYRRLVMERAGYLEALGRQDEARDEVTQAVAALRSQGVPEPVLEGMTQRVQGAATSAATGGPAPRRRRPPEGQTAEPAAAEEAAAGTEPAPRTASRPRTRGRGRANSSRRSSRGRASD